MDKSTKDNFDDSFSTSRYEHKKTVNRRCAGVEACCWFISRVALETVSDVSKSSAEYKPCHRSINWFLHSRVCRNWCRKRVALHITDEKQPRTEENTLCSLICQPGYGAGAQICVRSRNSWHLGQICMSKFMSDHLQISDHINRINDLTQQIFIHSSSWSAASLPFTLIP